VDGAENPVTEKRTVYFECKSGCTLIESILLLVFASVILLVAQRPLLEFHRVSIILEQQKVVSQGDFQSFLNLLKSELIQAGDALTS